MFALAWIFLPDLPEYRTGLIIVGLARCIAMVIIWNDLACGDREAAAVLVALNSVFQVARVRRCSAGSTSTVLPGWLGLGTAPAWTSPSWDIAAATSLIFLGIPLLAGFLTRRIGERRQGPRLVRDRRSCPKIGPFALYGLLFTIVILFALQGDAITSPAAGRRPHRAAAAGLLRHHVGRLLRSSARALGLGYERTTTLAFTAAGNNFELAIAVAIAHLRRHLRPGPRRRRRPAHRGPRPRRPGLRQPVGAARFFPPRRPSRPPSQ